MDNYLIKAFIGGSSAFSFIYTMRYVSYAFLKLDPNELINLKLKFPTFALYLPLIFGILNVIAIYLSRYSQINTRLFFLIYGAFVGVMLSFIGTFVYDLPLSLFKFSEKYKYFPLIFAPIMYSFIFGFSVYNVNHTLGII